MIAVRKRNYFRQAKKDEKDPLFLVLLKTLDYFIVIRQHPAFKTIIYTHTPSIWRHGLPGVIISEGNSITLPQRVDVKNVQLLLESLITELEDPKFNWQVREAQSSNQNAPKRIDLILSTRPIDLAEYLMMGCECKNYLQRVCNNV